MWMLFLSMLSCTRSIDSNFILPGVDPENSVRGLPSGVGGGGNS